MKALSLYQQAILTEIGITQWQLRTPADNDINGDADIEPRLETDGSTALDVKEKQTPAKPLDTESAANILAGLKAAITDEPAENQSSQEPATAAEQTPPARELTDLSGKLLLNMDKELGETALVRDVLQALGLEADAIEYVTTDLQNCHRQSFSWLIQQTEVISLETEALITPQIDKLTNSTELKQELWHAISQKLTSQVES